MKKNIIDDQRMMLRVSDLYYNQDLSQQQIANKLSISRPTISKLLKTARDIGIVQITISDINGRKYYQLEQRLEEKYNLKEVVVVETHENSSQTKEAIGEAASKFLAHILKEGDTVGVSMGTTLSTILNYKQDVYFSNLTFVPLIGGIGTVANNLHSNSIAEGLSQNFGGYYLPIHAPAMVSRIKTKTELMKENSIKRVFKKAKHLDIALMGIGVPRQESTMIKTGYFTPEMIQELQDQNICGDICMNFFDHSGNIDHYEYNEKVVGINIKDLRKIQYSIALCCGSDKCEAIQGAINGGYINILITDYTTANQLNQIEQ
jgi:deoxyribonucleoside regulator